MVNATRIEESAHWGVEADKTATPVAVGIRRAAMFKARDSAVSPFWSEVVRPSLSPAP